MKVSVLRNVETGDLVLSDTLWSRWGRLPEWEKEGVSFTEWANSLGYESVDVSEKKVRRMREDLMWLEGC